MNSIPPSISVSQNNIHGFTPTATDNLTYTKTIKLDNGHDYVITITFKNTDTDKEAFLKKFDDTTSKKIVNAAVNMGLGVTKNKPAEVPKLMREYTITSMQFHIGEDGEMRVRKTKTKPGEKVETDRTKKLTESSETKQKFLLEIQSVFTGSITNKQEQQPNQQIPSTNPSSVHNNNNQGASTLLKPNPNQQSNTNNLENSPIQQTSSLNNPLST